MPSPAEPVAAPSHVVSTLHQLARDALGIDELRPGQLEAATAVMDGRDTLLVMPTGSGKSAVYQLAGALIEGPTVIVSPLIALQKDQVESIAMADLGFAAAANSTLGDRERRWIFEALRCGGLEFLFVAPEQLGNEETLAELREARPSLFVVDEAHCISEWGHDFRPEYLRLDAAIAALGRPTVLALTATASPVVRGEIIERLGLDDPRVVVHGFDRPNLRLEVQTLQEEYEKTRSLVDHVARLDAPGIVYVATRRQTEDLAALVRERSGRSAEHYHGGMRARDRHDAQERFMEGRTEVMVATTAFGMGIDKADVRYVIHYDVPESVDSYYQEVGRAGRDGKPSLALLLWRPEDLGLRKFFAGAGQIGPDELHRVAIMLEVADRPVTLEELRHEAGMSETRLGMALSRLEDVGAVTVSAEGMVALAPGAPPAAEAAERASAGQESRQQVEQSRLDMMRGYAQSGRTCRRRFVLTYFGEPAEEWCGNCDVCDRVRGGPATNGFDPAVRWAEQSRVVHKSWGQGLILRHEGDSIVVLFDEAGYRTLSLELVEQHQLLQPVA